MTLTEGDSMTYLELLQRVNNQTNPKVVECYGTLYKWNNKAYRDSSGVSIIRRMTEDEMVSDDCIRGLVYEVKNNG